MPPPSLARRAAMVAAILALAACGAVFKTDYDAPVDRAVSAQWRVASVEVDVPHTLTVSEARTLLPRADIVWREDPVGDRYAQVDQIMTDAISQGASGLHGSRPVRIEAVMSRFHALTFEAEARPSGGVHNIDFTIQVVDAASGQVLVGPTAIEAAFPALGGADMIAARQRGETQKSMIIAHVRRVIAGWLGIGPDPREKFSKLGG
ncbi:MAG: hypothetical protein H6895_07220 [Defluviimonas sp.]|uniref:DUF6778 family protein n=1 Tax=Albidovulum sp. TaxID=1872424 RepID=UPI001E0C3CF7|nr:hypothetical protein [Paracoccaceae bacterium]MCC0063860.1 hypothetical protein [Defluviimonas sp.]